MIIDLQRRIAEVGRIRIGQQVPTSNGKSRPAKLATFRLTSPDRQRIHRAAELFGGEPAEWEAPAGKQWEVVTTTDALAVIVPPSEMAFSQWYELWSAGGCRRRCDGATESINEQQCVCDPEDRECDIHTRLSVMLRDLPGLGVWRIDTKGWYAAVELSGAVQVVQAAAGRGALLPARLRLEQRSVKRQVDGAPQTLRFAVPVLDIEISPAQLLAGESQTPVLTDGASGRAAVFTPVPAELPAGPGLSIAEQSEPPPPKPRRSNAAPEIPRSGRRRNTNRAADGQEQVPEEPDWDARIAEYEANGDRDKLAELWKRARALRPDDGNLFERIEQAGERIRADQAVTAMPSSSVAAMTPAKRITAVHAWFTRHNVPDADKHSYISALVAHEVTSTKELTDAETTALLTQLDRIATEDDPLTALQEIAAEYYERPADTGSDR